MPSCPLPVLLPKGKGNWLWLWLWCPPCPLYVLGQHISPRTIEKGEHVLRTHVHVGGWLTAWQQKCGRQPETQTHCLCTRARPQKTTPFFPQLETQRLATPTQPHVSLRGEGCIQSLGQAPKTKPTVLLNARVAETGSLALG